MNFVTGFAKLLIIAFYFAILLLAANQHKKPLRGTVNFWAALTIVAANIVTLVSGGFFRGFFNFTA